MSYTTNSPNPRRQQAAKVAASRSAENRKCPKCGRGSALQREVDTDQRAILTACRWCEYRDVRTY